MYARNNRRGWVLVAFIIFSVAVCGVEGGTIYVDSSAFGADDGTSWADAFVYLQDALADSKPGDEIWVAKGVYRPDQGGGHALGDQNASFNLVNGVSIYGGFPEGGGFWEDRDEGNETVLSGDLNENDSESYTSVSNAYNSSNRKDNSYHVVTATLCGPHTIIDMVTITCGNASASDAANTSGGGLYNYNNASPTFQKCKFVLNSARGSVNPSGGGAVLSINANSKPVFLECVFRDNFGEKGGAVIDKESSDPTFVDCMFSNNLGDNDGGAIYNNSASPIIRGCTFISNSVANDHGGAIHNNASNPTIQRCKFEGNLARNHGGAIYNYDSAPIIEDCVFIENESMNLGGAIMNHHNDEPVIERCIFYVNTAGDDGGGIYFYNPIADTTIRKCIFCGNNAQRYGGAIRTSGRPIQIVNCWFSTNYTLGAKSYGGAIYLDSSTASVYNCSFWNNEANQEGGGIYCGSREMEIHNSIFWENKDEGGVQQDESAQITGTKYTATYCCIQGLLPDSFADGNNISSDPCFVDTYGIDWLPGTPDDNLRLDFVSPCLDAGDNTMVPTGVITDIDGGNRFTDYPHTADTGKGSSPIVDMGASEMCPLRWWSLEEPAVQPEVCHDWEYLGRPGCWCGQYQCDGDTDGVTSGFPANYRVYLGDLNLLVNNWQRRIDDPELDPCADIDHRDSGFPARYRIYLGDLNILVKNWMKKDAELDGDCPRVE